MRPSQRNLILDAAIRVTERDGITALTLEAAAEEAGVTKGGLMYHFRTRDELLLAIQRHLATALERRLAAALGKPLEEASPREAAATYVRVGGATPASKAELAFMVESVTHPGLAEVWDELMARWAPVPQEPTPEDVDLLLARLAADGLWLNDATGGPPLPEPVRAALLERIATLAGGS
ncbi:TetR family transcriptional regulator [Streptomyces sp. 8K308]|uniref:TetR/AcrR family transcriptional regulator n=1 Tax=Streptomyces sp. 8K308 TaxID=2530388 RepID=UPI00104C810B|nr:TetR family transcriptional regulator [Streptomyces sp. 8K308]TDC18900.1 TetR family transcriptional regulator [Streptomyces sp. 8K308]